VVSTRQLLRNLTFANQLTFLRLIVIPFLAIALLNDRPRLALALFAVAAVTDAFDGLVARILKQKTALGALLDPVADKLLLTTALVVLSLPDHLKIAPDFMLTNRIPIWLIVLAISRDAFIIVTVTVLYLVIGIHRFPPSRLGKLTTFFVIALVSLVLLYNARDVESTFVIPLVVWATLAFTLMSGFHYIYRTSVLVREAQQQDPAPPAAPAARPATEDAPRRTGAAAP